MLKSPLIARPPTTTLRIETITMPLSIGSNVVKGHVEGSRRVQYDRKQYLLGRMWLDGISNSSTNVEGILS